jgi:hypothetical protein
LNSSSRSAAEGIMVGPHPISGMVALPSGIEPLSPP